MYDSELYSYFGGEIDVDFINYVNHVIFHKERYLGRLKDYFEKEGIFRIEQQSMFIRLKAINLSTKICVHEMRDFSYWHCI